MKQSKIMNAYRTVDGIRRRNAEKKDTPSDINYIFYKLYLILKPQYDFQVEEEKKIFEPYDPQFHEDGSLEFKTEEDAKVCAEKLENLANLEIDLKYEKIDFHPDGRSDITVDEMIALEDFLNYA